MRLIRVGCAIHTFQGERAAVQVTRQLVGGNSAIMNHDVTRIFGGVSGNVQVYRVGMVRG